MRHKNPKRGVIYIPHNDEMEEHERFLAAEIKERADKALYIRQLTAYEKSWTSTWHAFIRYKAPRAYIEDWAAKRGIK